MPINIANNRMVSTAKVASIDQDYGPYTGQTLQQALSQVDNILAMKKAEGKTVGIKVGDGQIVEYWYQYDTNDQLVLERKVDDGSGKMDKIPSSAEGNIVVFDNEGNADDIGISPQDFATAQQGAKADTAYQKPETNIPLSDLSQEVVDLLNTGGGSVQEVMIDGQTYYPDNGVVELPFETEMTDQELKGGESIAPHLVTSKLLKDNFDIDGNTITMRQSQIQVPQSVSDLNDASDYYTKTEADTLLSAKADDSAVVHLTGFETIYGKKVFYERVVVLGDLDMGDSKVIYLATPTDDTDATTKKYVDDADALKANDSNVVHLTGNETIQGVKEFSGTLVTTGSVGLNNSATVRGGLDIDDTGIFMNGTKVEDLGTPTNDTDAANKKYVDDTDALKANDADVVHTTGDETIGGVKQFSDGIEVLNDGAITVNSGGIDVYNEGIITVNSGSIDMNTNKVQNLGTPIDDYDAATKKYVDDGLSAKQDTLVFDEEPTIGSTNPVTSRGVYNALSGVYNMLQFDADPTMSSKNPVHSGGVYSALQLKADDSGVVHTTLDEQIRGVKDFIHGIRLQNGMEVFGGNIDFGNIRLSNTGYPTNSSDAATKQYVDTVVGSASIREVGNIGLTQTSGTLAKTQTGMLQCPFCMFEYDNLKFLPSEVGSWMNMQYEYDTLQGIVEMRHKKITVDDDYYEILQTPTASIYDKSATDRLLGQKQDVISDIDDIRSGAALGATSVQQETDPIFFASAAHSITQQNISDWNGKQDALTFDNTPTSGSTNPVTSQGIKSALDTKATDDNVVHKTTDEIINGKKTFGSEIVLAQAGTYGPSYSARSMMFDNTRNRPAVYTTNNEWVMLNGQVLGRYDNQTNRFQYIPNQGTTEQRPDSMLTSRDVGFMYYDTTIKRFLFWNSEDWAETGEPSSWTQTNESSPSFIADKPSIMQGSGTNATIQGDTSSNSASGDNAHSEGSNCNAAGNASHAEGYGTVTSNYAEHASGSWNISTKESNDYGDPGNTLGSVGFGTDDDNRKNAIQVMQNGDVYVYDIGGFDGTNRSQSTRLQDAFNGSWQQSNWNEEQSSQGSYILNKPSVSSGSGMKSIVEGNIQYNIASGEMSHAEGDRTQAQGNSSHAEGKNTMTNNPYEHAQGMYNASHTSQSNTPADMTMHSIGIGNPSARMNAMEVMYNGDVYVLGLGNYDGTNPNAAGTLSLQDILVSMMPEWIEI